MTRAEPRRGFQPANIGGRSRRLGGLTDGAANESWRERPEVEPLTQNAARGEPAMQSQFQPPPTGLLVQKGLARRG